MDPLWNDFVEGSAPPGHAMKVYGDHAELADSVAEYLVAGFEAGEPAVILPTREHWALCESRLEARGWPAERIDAAELLLVADAAETLDAITVDGRPSRERFDAIVGAMLDRAHERFPGRHVRAFGQLVDLLAARNDLDAATQVEEFWNDRGAGRDFGLLCAYGVDVFAAEGQTVLAHVCRQHSHVDVDEDRGRLTRAVDTALESVVGPTQAGRIYVLASKTESPQVPLALLVLMWVVAELPSSAGRILAAARAHYAQEPRPATA